MILSEINIKSNQLVSAVFFERLIFAALIIFALIWDFSSLLILTH